MIEKSRVREKFEREKRSDICLEIPIYHRYETTGKMFDLFGVQSVGFDIVVIDNDSVDRIFEKLASDLGRLNLLRAEKNYGVAGELSLKQKYAIILSNNDALSMDENLIEKIVEVTDGNTITKPVNRFPSMIYAVYLRRGNW